MVKHISTEIKIQVEPEKVWEKLTQIEHYPKWNPFIKRIEGILAKDERLNVVIQPVESSEMKFKPRVIGYEENRLISWKGKLFIKGIFDGTHSFELIDNQDGSTTFVQSEKFAGILVGIFNLENTEKGFIAMNRKLKELCEVQ